MRRPTGTFGDLLRSLAKPEEKKTHVPCVLSKTDKKTLDGVIDKYGGEEFRCRLVRLAGASKARLLDVDIDDAFDLSFMACVTPEYMKMAITYLTDGIRTYLGDGLNVEYSEEHWKGKPDAVALGKDAKLRYSW